MEFPSCKRNNKTKNKIDENVLYLEITESLLVHYNVFNTSYQQDSRVLCTLVSSKSFGQLLEIL